MYSPGEALKNVRVWGFQNFEQSAHEGDKVFSPTHRPALFSQKILLVLISVRDWVDPRAIVRQEWLMLASGIEHATFRLVVQCLNKLHHPTLLDYKFFFVALRPNAGHGLLILEVSSSHTTTHHIR